ncbi:recombinase family protein [Candidatus Gracilibacteria bacterium]|nr:recombinase family protein [Candidatus Gracilibacteria bacterium]
MTEIKYCLYARKSSESDERQALSIDNQIQEMQEKAKREGLNISGTLIESHSAKETGKRPIYNQLIGEIKKGKYNGIITWAPDRLSRNAGDLGSLVDLMDQGKLEEIRTNGQNFRNSPNEKFLLMILCSQAKLENDNKGVNVVRGLKNKAKMGIRPGIAPIGYLNQKSFERNGGKIILDSERDFVIKQIFEKVAYDGYKGRDIYKWLKEDLGFKTRTGSYVALSLVYRILNDTFYYGEFEYPKESGNFYKGNYEPIITKDLFEQVQKQLNLGVRYREKNKVFTFTRIMKCGNCGSGITAHEKFKKLASGKIISYVYYNCTKAKNLDCKEKMIEENELIRQLIGIIDILKISETDVSDKLKEELKRFNNFQSLFGKIQNNKNNYNDIGINDYMKYLLREGERGEKREILSYIKSNIFIRDKKILLE